MHTLIELWNAKDQWRALSDDARQDYLEKMGAMMPALAEAGIEVVGWGFVDRQADRSAPYDFFAVWQAEDAKALSGLLEMVSGGGWYDYFEQHNVLGELTTPDVVLGHLAGLN